MKSKQRPVTVADLKKAPDDAHLHCDECGSQFSATYGDYFMLSADHVFEHCGEPMRLVRRVVRYETVTL